VKIKICLLDYDTAISCGYQRFRGTWCLRLQGGSALNIHSVITQKIAT